MREVITLRFVKHEIFGQRIDKAVLSAKDDKRVIQPAYHTSKCISIFVNTLSDKTSYKLLIDTVMLANGFL